jgi:uncharacterized protein
MYKSFIIILIISTSYLFAISQDDLPERPESWVNDYANVLSNSEKQNLDAMLSGLETRSSNQIFIALFKTMPENYYLEDFAVKLYEKWKPGLADQDNGILMVIFIDDRKIRIEVGYGLEDVVTDAQSGAVIRDFIAPHFQTGDYYGGIKAALDVLIPAAEGKYQIPIEQKRTKSKDSPISTILTVFFIFIVLSRIFGRRSTGFGSRGRHTGFGGPFIFGGGRGGSGGGFSGGGFSGGFGGMSGGGGASGSW